MSKYRVVARPRCVSGRTTIFSAASIREAEYIRDQFLAGAYDDPAKYASVTVRIYCDKHGWARLDGEMCARCLDECWEAYEEK